MESQSIPPTTWLNPPLCWKVNWKPFVTTTNKQPFTINYHNIMSHMKHDILVFMVDWTSMCILCNLPNFQIKMKLGSVQKAFTVGFYLDLPVVLVGTSNLEHCQKIVQDVQIYWNQYWNIIVFMLRQEASRNGFRFHSSCSFNTTFKNVPKMIYAPANCLLIQLGV